MRNLLLLITCIILCPSLLWATPRTVTITWTMPDNTDAQEYKVYYADNNAMANKVLHNDCSPITENPANTFTLSCNNIDLTDNQTYYFIIEAHLTDGTLATSSPQNATFIVNTPMAPDSVKDFKIVTPGENIAPTAVATATPTSGTLPLTVNFSSGNSTDSDGTISSYSWNFGDGSPISTTANPNHVFTTAGTFTVSLTVTDDDGTVSTAALTSVTVNETPSGVNYAINFQPGDAPDAEGFSNDHGLVFDSTRGYGWNAYMPNSRDRNNPISPDQSYDTNITYISSTSIWEVTIPNGNYNVTVCAGDPSYPSGLQSIQVEGISIIHETISNELKWVEHTIATTVSDGKLTMTFQDSNDTKLCWIKIYSAQ